MRILVLPKEFPSPARPQAGIFILRRVQALRALGHEIEVVRIMPYAPPIGTKWKIYAATPYLEYVDGIPVRTIRAIVPPRMLGMEYVATQVYGALEREIKRFSPDVLNASFLIPCGQAAVRHNIPTVVTSHGTDAYSWPKRRPGLFRAAREAIVKATRVTAVSDYIRQCIMEIAPRHVDVIWNGGDERYFYPRDRASSRAELGLPQDRFIVAYAGNVLRAKGLYELLDAAASLADMRPFLVLAGEGSESAALSAHAEKLGVELHMLGRLDPPAVGAVFGAADIVTLPSYAEGLPNVVCEAMLAQRAVVATTVGGIPEIVQDGRTGILVPPKDARALASALRSVGEDSALRDWLAAEARAFASEHLTWRVSARGYESVFLQAMDEAARAQSTSQSRKPYAS